MKNTFDNVTTENLGTLFRMVGVEVDPSTIDAIIDSVELLYKKGDKVTLKDAAKIKAADLECAELNFKWLPPLFSCEDCKCEAGND